MTDLAKKTDTVTLTIDGIEVTAPKGALLIRVAEELGIAIPRFCDHPLLAPAGACRQCLVDVEGQRKPVASCTQTVADGMVVRTQLTSEVAKKAQAGIMELLLVNHPLDCPMCDKGGECPLQNQAMSTGRTDSRFHEHKREYPKPLPISTQVLLDRERCVLCQRCTRFSEEIAGDKFIDLMGRSSAEEINIYRDEAYGVEDPDTAEVVPFNSYFSGNTVQICPVGALTGAQYRFRARPFDLVSTPSVCEHCSAGCAQRTDWRRGKVLRRLAGDDPAVNEEWNCDKGRWGFRYATAGERLNTPLVRDGQTGELREASWSEALAVAAEGLRAARDADQGVGVLTGGRLTVEDAYAYAKFARVALGTNDIDFRARPTGVGGEEAEFLAAAVAGRTEVTYADLEKAPAVVLVGLEPEEECPILFLRLRKAHQKKGLKVFAIAPYASRGLEKLGAKVARVVPGQEAAVLAEHPTVAEALGEQGAVLLVGERLADVPGGLSAAAALAGRTGARLAWVPRRAGDRGAVDAGCLPNLLPGGRLVADPAARAELGQSWDVEPGVIPSRAGRGTDEIVAAAAAGDLGALVVAGVDPADLADPRAAEQALDAVPFLVSLELRGGPVTRRADVVLPVAPVVEKAGSFLDWEGRLRTFEAVLNTPAMTDGRVLDALAAQLGVQLGTGSVNEIRRELGALPTTRADRAAAPTVAPGEAARPGTGEAVLATWHQLIDSGTLTEGDSYLNGTARPPVVRLSRPTAEAIGAAEGEPVTVGTDRGAITLPVALTEMPDGVVWLPTNSPGSSVRRALGVPSGALVRVTAGDRSGGAAGAAAADAAHRPGPLLNTGSAQ
ncbi:NADH-quinone oxidoreductase subunit G [Plantactinospora sp. KBS50]|uniref:NADH-quinone oxidoreductase subunit G n=1 Tax=Plantactinospora sp. KBS50 TaxID=2024580 RepID=UPI000BAAE4AF|nr:NADH-quinone oxidoreductase subunit G [Plantactinospora sp. KBS50]ASW53222.1 NADH-quinone oxidoreductase subunit G [Plantactinospora sp. KBS50]